MTLSRRSFLKAAATCAAVWTVPVSRADSPFFKNVMVIIGDDHSARVLGAYGNSIIRTPNLDRMASRGVRFTHAFANAPVCSASRQSLLTGRYPHAAGVTLLQTPFPDEQITVAEHLQQFGFRTGYVGKMHFNNNLAHGFESRVEARDYRKHLEEQPPQPPPEGVRVRPPWRPFQDHARVWLNAEGLPSQYYDKDDIGTWYSNKAIEFLEQNRNRRFCLWLGYHEPHSPFNFPIEYAGKYDPRDMPMPQNSPEDDRWIPRIFADLTGEERRGIIASYYTSVEYLDKNIGLVLDALDRLGLTKETLVIYIGDHGYLLNDHKRFEKHTMWEEAVGAPLIFLGEGGLPRNEVRDQLCEFVDLVPTITEALGVPHLTTVQGKSLMPVLQNSAAHKDYVFSEFLVDNLAMVRTKQWKYVFTTGQRDLGQGYETGYGAPGITHRLYDLANDPHEHRNIAHLPEHRETLHHLQNIMIRHFMETDPRAPMVPRDLSVEETLAWFCEPPEGNAGIDGK